MNKLQVKADFALILVAFIWGATFTMVKEATADFPVFPFLTLRFFIALVVLFPVALRANKTLSIKALWLSIFAGICFFTGFAFQTFGLRYIGPGRAGFITGLAVVLVPVGGALFLKVRISRGALFGVVLAVLGLVLLTGILESSGMSLGDGLVLMCALAFAGHILAVGQLPIGCDWRIPTAIQVMIVACFSLVFSVFTIPGSIIGLIQTAGFNVWFAAVFTGLLATAFALSCQTWAQQFTSTTHTALIFSGEPVFAALFGYLLFNEKLTFIQILGCIFILLGMVAAEMPSLSNRKP